MNLKILSPETTIIYDCVEIGENSVVEPYVLLGINDRFHPESSLIIGKNAFIGSRCTIYTNVKAGENFDVSDQTSIFTDNQFGDDVRIGPKSVIKNGCRVGNNVRINSQVFMERVILEDNVFIGPHTVFSDDLHPPCPRYEDCVPKAHVESFVSIGANVFIAPGVRIGHHTQIYGGTTVLSDIEANSVVAGNPGKVVKKFSDLECRPGFFKKPFEWWDD